MVSIVVGLFSITAAVNLQVPLYTTYAADAHVGNALTAIVFASYVGGLIPVLILFGGASDRFGCKPILLLSLLCAFVATLAMIVLPSLRILLFSRILQGIAVALSMGTCTAYLIKLYPDKSHKVATYVALASALGFGSGAACTTLVLSYHQSISPASYWIVFVLTGFCFVSILFGAPHTSKSIGKLIRVPTFPKGTLLVNLSIALAWTVSGLVIAVLPAQLKLYGLQYWVGPALFLVNGVGAACQLVVRKMKGVNALTLGFILMPLGYGLLVLGSGIGSLVLILAGASIAGAACYGFTYLGGLNQIVKVARNENSRAVSGYFLFAYLGFGIPSVLLGFIADAIGTLRTLSYFAGVIVLCCISLSIAISRRAHHDQKQATVTFDSRIDREQ
ncbi:MAG: MFS transporter [Sulfobacillus thermotolerans]|nr:MFS transporter [Sulfobacillus thermotolerans]